MNLRGPSSSSSMPGALKVLATKCPLWVISGHQRTDQEMSALPSKADMFSVEIYVPRCHQRTTYWAALEQRDTVFLATLCKRSAPHQEVESSAVTALSQQEVSHGYHPQTRSKVASPNPEGRSQTNLAFVPCVQRRRGLGTADGSSS